jgi:hypothetical protein
MKSSTVSNVKTSDSVDHNNLFLQTLAHNVANSAGTKGFIPYGQYTEKTTQNELLFNESLNTENMQFRAAAKKLPTMSNFSMRKQISMFSRYDSFKDSKA